MDDNEVGMIGICGMDEIEKNIIMKHICNQLLRETKPLFDKIIWVTISKELNITYLQKDIANVVGIGVLPKPKPERVAILIEELGRRKYVLILYDVCEKLSLMNVGIHKPTSNNGSKLVLTSKSIEFCKIVQVPPLSDEESMNLFLEFADHGF
ncbi:hypothetical protein V6N13_112128 [Hibiscus sabdariffa]|uniref:NB-ARC domain-containing protein n=1 Tax=Hibiscus sabdariffa TaxID=183260 RepID=A0ABR2TMR9_9ROSI